ncbi:MULTISPECIES: hypothetical protein [Peribacillus]|uniref:hypothetical protein n=1 Tax=Peribacillus TaxID=2675229 RepID=UPI001F4EFEDB|nr:MULTISPECIES: hypothetical protein [unclassified Peribacillus]MCK1981484.1 hypothetical protein [Peribacillus sp. Aquil_B1]MCK2006769.1 hypothetical protein [Peribacillus sp. Aquil_B8]
MKVVRKTKDIGFVSLSFALCLIGILFTIPFGDKPCIGDNILNNEIQVIIIQCSIRLYFSSLPLSLVIFIPIIEEQKQEKIISGFQSILIVSVLLTIFIDLVWEP